MSEQTASAPTAPFDPTQWREVEGFGDLVDLTYHRHVELGCVRVAFDRPEVRNAFRPGTVDELYRALDHARTSPDVGRVSAKSIRRIVLFPAPEWPVRNTNSPRGT